MTPRPRVLATGLVIFTIAGTIFAGLDLSAGVDEFKKLELLDQVKRKTLVPLKDPISHVDINGDGVPDLIIKSRRTPGPTGRSYVFYHFFISEEFVGRYELYEIGSASGYGDDECMRDDVRLLVPNPGSGDGLTRIDAYRSLGEHLYAPGTVTFTFFRVKDTADFSGAYNFVEEGKFDATGQYCDVGEAFEKELGLVQRQLYT